MNVIFSLVVNIHPPCQLFSHVILYVATNTDSLDYNIYEPTNVLRWRSWLARGTYKIEKCR
ncbi:unnamed protein product, partial [Strongylus vulgaris]